MRLSWKWLNEFISLPVTIEEVAQRLTETGSEVESIEYPCALVRGIIVARVVECVQHSTKSGLTVTRLDIGDGNSRLCVTAAKNVTLGCVVPYAISGSRTASGMELGYRDFDGFLSDGMMASATELGVPDLSSVKGILLLPDDAPLGVDVAQWLGLDDAVIDLSITSNRGDLLSYLGVARELYALFPESELHVPQPEVTLCAEPWTVNFEGLTSIDSACRAYRLGLADGVKVAPAPLHDRVKLCFSGMRPVNNIVDATNLAMLALGQPLHAFDADRLSKPEISVRFARQGEVMESLDGKERTLLESDLVISSGDEAIGLAGVMGGLNSEITDATERILIESANFDAPVVARTSRRLGLVSEAAYRYARGVDPQLTAVSLLWVQDYLTRWGAARCFSQTFYTEQKGSEARQVSLSARVLSRVSGREVDLAKASTRLQRLGLKVLNHDEEQLSFEIPSWRSDLSIEEDLIEEITRIDGYDDVTPAIPKLYKAGSLGDFYRTHRTLRSVALARGYSEVVTYSFISPEMLEKIQEPSLEQCRRLSNPLSADLSIMRPTLVPSLLAGLDKALRGGWRQPVRIFEVGKAFVPQGETVVERHTVAGLVFAGLERHRLYGDSSLEDFLSVKGDVEALVLSQHMSFQFEATEICWGHVGQSARILCNGQPVGFLARLKPSVASQWDLDAPTYLFEIDMSALVSSPLPVYKAISEFPPVLRDISILAPRSVTAEALDNELKELGQPLVTSVRLVDFYDGQGIPEGFKSLSFSMTYRDDRTLRDEEVEASHGKVRKELEKRGYTLR